MEDKKLQGSYDVVIIGGGPVGTSLAIELGLLNIRTLIIEKYERPPHTPRAQSLSARTMEFFLRWGIDKALEERILLPKNYPPAGIWCSALNGETYFVGYWGDNELDANASPKMGVRIPLWITEAVLRKRLQDFPSITFLRNHEAYDIIIHDKNISVLCLDKVNQIRKIFNANFLACCDGAKGFSKEKFSNPFEKLSEKTKILSISFMSKEIMRKKSIPDGIFYSINSEAISSFFWPIDLNTGLCVSQIICEENFSMPDESSLSLMIDEMIGFHCNKKIIEAHFWDMQVQLAEFFSYDRRVFWLGDAAHAFAPTGGLGLNTGIGDAQNLGWKLAYAIKGKAPPALLTTYDIERRAVCLNNLNFAKQNAEDVVKIKQKYPPAKNYKKFALENAALGNRFLKSSGLTMGYRYLNSPLTQNAKVEGTPNLISQYKPTAEPGYFIPHSACQQGISLYEKLAPTQWNLLVCGKQNMIKLEKSVAKQFLLTHDIKILELEENTYPYPYVLLRPDWHIARVENTFEKIATPLYSVLES